MPASPRRLHSIPSGADRIPQDPVAYLARLWKAFEKSGAVSAYIAYRMQLAHLVRGDQLVTVWTRDGPQYRCGRQTREERQRDRITVPTQQG